MSRNLAIVLVFTMFVILVLGINIIENKTEIKEKLNICKKDLAVLTTKFDINEREREANRINDQLLECAVELTICENVLGYDEFVEKVDRAVNIPIK